MRPDHRGALEPDDDEPCPAIPCQLGDLFGRVAIGHERLGVELRRHGGHQRGERVFRSRPALDLDARQVQLRRERAAYGLDDRRGQDRHLQGLGDGARDLEMVRRRAREIHRGEHATDARPDLRERARPRLGGRRDEHRNRRLSQHPLRRRAKEDLAHAGETVVLMTMSAQSAVLRDLRISIAGLPTVTAYSTSA